MPDRGDSILMEPIKLYLEKSSSLFIVHVKTLFDKERVAELGGLVVQSGSHKAGVFPTHKAGPAGVSLYDEALQEEKWVTSPFMKGDALFFHSHTIHKALPNNSGNLMRLSVDYRYQKSTDPFMEDLLMPHKNRLSWEEVYRDWKSDEYKYYWKDLDLKTVVRKAIAGTGIPKDKY